MCGRFAYHATAAEFEAQFGTAPPEGLQPSWNITPQRPIPAVREDGACLLHWGLLPFWAKDRKLAYKTINAKAETVADKPAFRAAWRRRRCLIPASGWYEWQQGADGKQPWYIRPAGGGLLAFAGLWEHWEGKGEDAGTTVASCSIITTAANARCAGIHERMPVVVLPPDYQRYLEAPRSDLLAPCPDDYLESYPVSRRVNSPKNDSPELVEALA